MNVILSAEQNKPDNSLGLQETLNWKVISCHLEGSSQNYKKKSHGHVFCLVSISSGVFPLFLTRGSDGTDTVLSHPKL